ncbi:condensin-2 complex subunit D3-like isoform X2 [Acropora muricata]|uniref:condensin-2 complex subunit D3-like isoform X2 n=1 Tax=Acropora muricata TaxID=159855 RepID=UPI0034E4875E
MQSERERRTEDLRSIGQRFVTQSVDISFVSFIDSGDKSPHPGPKLESCIMAANIYIILIQVSGSGAYNIFHPLLFQKDLDVLRLWPCKVEKKRKRRNEATAGGRKAKAGRGKSNDHEDMEAENVAVGGSDDDDDCDNDDDNDYLYGQMSTEEAKASIKVKLLSLMQGPDLFSEIHCFGGNYIGLDCLCSQLHGDVGANTRTVFKHLISNFLMISGSSSVTSNGLVLRDVQTIKDQAIQFVNHITHKSNKEMPSGVKVLVQVICTKCTKRAEYGSVVAKAVVDIMDKLPVTLYASLVE